MPPQGAGGMPPQDFGGQPPQGPGPDGTGFAPGPEGPAPRSGFQKARTLIGGIVVIALLAVGGWSLWSNYQTTSALEVGKCVVVTGTEDDPDVEEADCDGDDFTFAVGKVEDRAGACGDGYLEFSVSRERRGQVTDETVGCLYPNFKVDTCYDELPADDLMVFAPVDCPGGYFKISSVEESVDAECGAEAIPLFTVPEPARTFCAVEPA